VSLTDAIQQFDVILLTDLPLGPNGGGAERVAETLLIGLRGRTGIGHLSSVELLSGADPSATTVNPNRPVPDETSIERLYTAVPPAGTPALSLASDLLRTVRAQTILNFHAVWLWGLPDKALPLDKTIYSIHDYWPFCVRRNRTDFFKGQCQKGDFVRCFMDQNVRPLLPTSLNPFLPGQWYRLVRVTLNNSGCVITPSDFMRDYLAENGIEESNITVIRNGVDESFFKPPLEVDSDRNIILFVGRPERVKGLHVLLKAYRQAGLPYRLVIVGPRGESNGTENYLGKVSDSQLASLYASARAVVVPSLWPENCSMVILEAMSSGAPVIASRLGGNSELVQDGVNGVLTEPGDVVALRDALRSLRDSTLVRDMGGNGRRLVESRFTLGEFLNAHEKVYERVRNQ